ncbi:MAG: hypothetical protein RQ757_03785 [Pseudomonadales bacterium]|nr:hypothetical protein [Pseudomonadales bacterium]
MPDTHYDRQSTGSTLMRSTDFIPDAIPDSVAEQHRVGTVASCCAGLWRRALRLCYLLLGLLAGASLVFAQVPGPLLLQGTGGTITTAGGFIVHTFTSSGTFTPPPGVSSVEVLVVAGGGGGGRGGNTAGGGGGGGGVLQQTVAVNGPATVTVGAGGIGGSGGGGGGNPGTPGGNSVFAGVSTATAIGGGDGGANSDPGGAGGSGGGGGAGTSNGQNPPGGAGTLGQGNAGSDGNGRNNNGQRSGGAGGGATQPGGVATNGNGGNGGNGFTSVAFGGTYGGGGGGGANNPGTGGTGGGGAGSTTTVAASGTNGLGGGGGGTRSGTAGNGGSGRVMVRYLPPSLTLTQQPSSSAASGTAFAQQPQITLLNGSGGGVPNVTITASLVSGGGTLGGTLTAITNASGVASFTNLSITGAAGVRTLGFTAAGSTAQLVSNGITIFSNLAINQQPSASVERGAVFAQQPIILANNGAPVSGLQVTATLLSGGGTLLGTTTVSTDANGLASFTNLAIAGDPGNRVLRFSAPGWGSVDSTAIQVTASTLSISLQPSANVESAVPFVQQPIVQALDGGGNPVSGVSVSVAVASGAGVLGGTITRITDANGNATFTDLVLTGPDGAHTLQFSASNWNPVISNTVTIATPILFFEILHAPSTGTCNVSTPITITAKDNFGNINTGFTGVMTVTSSGGTGNYSVNVGNPANFNNLTANDGIAQYTFTPADNGTVTLNFSTTTAGTISFTAESGARLTDPNHNLQLVVGACSVRIIHDTAASVCRPEPITIRMVDSSGNLVNFVGNINISTNGTTGGNWSKTSVPADANGTLIDVAPNDGFATYGFLASDAGEITLNFQDNTVETVNFNVLAAGVLPPAGAFDPDLTISACTFRVQHVGGNTTDVCSIKEIDITLVDGTGATVTGYLGTINLSTTTGFGTWVGGGGGSLVDPVPEDGSATYTFAGSDAGTVRLQFRHSSDDGVVNINVTDGVNLDPRNFASPFDQNLTVANCSFEIAHGGTTTACSVADITITVRNSLGGIAVDYLGTMNLGTNTNNGNWLLNPGNGSGSLQDTAGDDDGIASYAFHPDDDGVVILSFVDIHPEIVSINLVDGPMLEVGEFDPNLTVTSCFPNLFVPLSCTNPGNSTTVAVPARNPVVAQRSRMVLMLTMQEGTTDVSAATFNGANMTLIRREKNSNAPGITIEMWGILDADMPAAAGNYTGSFSGATAGTAMCLVSVQEVKQAFPVQATPATTGPLNSSQKTTSPDALTAATTISTLANNSLVVSLTANDNDFTNSNFFFFQDPVPSAVLTRAFGGLTAPGETQANPSGGRAAASIGVQAATGVTEVIETFSDVFSSTTLNAHIVAAFEPLVSGAPLASEFVPVVLFQTFSGNMSYHAIGNTLRTTPSQIGGVVDPAADCSFVDFAVGSQAALSLPAGATPVASFLYWMGSGTETDVDDTVDFGLTGTEVALTADEVFLVKGVTAQDVDFFAAFKDVSALVSGNGNYTLKNLVVQDGDPGVTDWDNNGTCAGGWAMVTVYEHPNERLRVLNLFHGFQPFQNSAFTLVPRNFRMATFTPPFLPNGQVTHITLEGDEDLDTGDESLGLQDAPGSATFTPIISSFNPPNSEFNATVTRPIYELIGSFFEFDADAGINGDGLEIDFPGPDVLEAGRTGKRIGSTWGVDVDTHFLGPDLLELFSQPGTEAERITTRYSAGQDLVLLVSEVISITNFPLADLEIFKTATSTFKVNQTGSYEISVVNNGNGALAGGEATGEVTVADTLPPGMTFASSADVSGTGWSCSVTLNPGAFTCIYDIANTAPGGQLAAGDSLPVITVNVQVGDTTFFPNQNNNAKNSIRALHSGGNCTAVANGLIPDPASCDRAPQFDNVNDLEGGSIDINTIDDKLSNNNNIDSVTVVVKGIEVDLRMDKFANGTFEAGANAQYTLRVSNFGPDATTSTFTVTDTAPAGVNFLSAAGTGWNCSGLPGPVLNCTHAGALAVGASTDILLEVDVVGVAGDQVTNTAQVTAGPFNFDVLPSNNVDTDITPIVGPPVASQERFLLSVSTPGNSTSIGGLNNFENHDLIIYDPVSDEATMFFDNSALGFGVNDMNAVHLLKNGHIVMSAASASTVGTNNLAFDPWDLAVYDPILGTAELFLDGTTVFQNPTSVDINAVYILDNGNILFSTADGGVAGSNNLAFTRSDIVMYDPSTGLASIVIDGSDPSVFDTQDIDIDAFYQRVDPADPNATILVNILSVSNETAVIGAGGDPVGGTSTSRDDVVELDLSAGVPNHTTENLFLGDVEFGIFEPIDAARRLDALHVVEDGYIGHFSITQVVQGDACTPMQLRISKHMGLTHNRDLDYAGSIEISVDSGIGNFGLISGSGNLNNGTSNDGVAIYTFVDGDDGTVILTLSQQDSPGLVNIDVSNRIASELATEDADFEFDPVFTPITYGDQFAANQFNNNDGSLFWANSWQEVDAFDGTVSSGAGVGVGNVRVLNGEARFTSNPNTLGGGFFPSLARTVNLDSVPFTEDVLLSFTFRYTGLAPADSFVVEARESSTAGWTTISTLSGFSGSGASSRNINLSSVLNESLFSATTEVRFRVASGYQVENFMFIDNVEVSTATTECGFTSEITLDHFAITHPGVGLACLATDVTISAHDVGHGLVFPEETILLSTSTGKGTWARVLSGSGTLSGAATLTGGADNGVASYSFPTGESAVTLRFNHTVPGVVNFNVSGQTSGFGEDPGEDPSLTVAAAGLVFFNETLLNNSILNQIAGKPSNVGPNASLLTVQAVRSSDEDPQACAPIFAPNETLTIGLGVECKDAGSCQAGETFQVNGQNIVLANDNGGTGAAGYQDVQLEFVTQPSGDTGASIILNYSDVGVMELHARYDIPFDNDPAETFLSGDFLFGTSNLFTVRPFGFDIDFSDGRQTNGSGDDSFAADADGSLFQIAGAPFDTTVTAMAWQAGDDTNNDGVPDAGANLTDNHPTPNFDQDSQAGTYSVQVSIIETKVPGGVNGVLTDDDFDNFVAGANTHTMNYNEVGIIDLRADLVDVNGDPLAYLGTDNIEGRVLNVGRFYPNQFTITDAVLNPRADQNCSPESEFTYMDEEFEVVLVLEANNLQGDITVNYRGAFAKLSAFADLNFAAITDVASADDINRSSRLLNVTMPVSYAPQWAASAPGVLELQGTLLISRADPAEPDGPFPDLQIAFKPQDSDGVTLPAAALNVDVDTLASEPGDPLFALIAEHDFYYGRMLVNNAFGSEFEPLAITLRVEYFDGERFITNNLDDCTFIDANELSFVTGTFTGDLVEVTNEPGIVAPDTSTFHDGQIQGLQAATNPLDAPLTIDPTDDNAVGTVDIELDLSALGLDYLRFEWLGVGDGDTADDDFDEMPRAQIEWGQFRSHDRVINWQEVYNAPTP